MELEEILKKFKNEDWSLELLAERCKEIDKDDLHVYAKNFLQVSEGFKVKLEELYCEHEKENN